MPSMVSSDPRDKTVLVIDDDEYICEFLRTILSMEGFKVAVAMDGTSALRIVDGKHVDLIVLDWMMPVLSGFDVLQKLQSGYHKDIPVIVVTARISDPDTVASILKQVSVKEFESKPLDQHRFTSKVHQLLKTVSIKEKEPPPSSHA